MTTIPLPDWPWQIVRRLARERGARIWLVGGAVRDVMLERPVHDWDFAVDRDATGLARAVGDALGGAYFPLDAKRGMGRVVSMTDDDARTELDFALLRGSGIETDLATRDFTVNAMALSEEVVLVDPLDGEVDLEAGLIRAVRERAFRDDSIRLLRAARLEAELGFDLEAMTQVWMLRDAALLGRASAERLRDEFVRGLAIPGASAFVQRLDDLDLLPHVVPELESLKGLAQSLPHRFDVWRHTMTVLGTIEEIVLATTKRSGAEGLSQARDRRLATSPPVDVPSAAWGELARTLSQFSSDIDTHLSVDVCADRDRALLLKMAALLHDAGKPETRSVDDDGRIHFHDHEHAGARMAAARLRDLRFSRREVRRVCTIVEGHLRPPHLARAEKVTRRAVYRYFRDTEDAGVEIVLLSLADHLATWGANLRPGRWRRRLEVAELLLHHYFKRYEETIAPPLLISGYDLMSELALDPGPEVGRLLEAVREAQAVGEIESRQGALALAGKLSEAAAEEANQA